MEEVKVRSVVAAAPEALWARVTTAPGINHELGPWLRMTMPRSLRGASLDDVSLGVRLGRSWILLLGLIPIDFDDLMLAERGPGHRFLETSSTFTMSPWVHERVVVAAQGGSTVTDTLRFEPRGVARRSRIARRLLRAIVGAIFRHRHRRLAAHFSKRSETGGALM